MCKKENNKDHLRSGIGILNENSLHADIIKSLAQKSDKLEAEVDGYYIDILRGKVAIEVQTSNLGKLSKKVNDLAKKLSVEIVYPIQKIKYISKISKDGKQLSQRKSPKQGKLTDVFDELVRAADIINDPRVSLTVLLIEAEEIWRDDGQGSWRRKGWSIYERNLLKIIRQYTFHSPEDLLTILPKSLSSPFSNRQLADCLGIRIRTAGKITYTFRKMGLIEIVGKDVNSYLFELL